MTTSKLSAQMLDALKALSISNHNYLPASMGTRRALIRRGLVMYHNGYAYLTEAGRAALRS